MLASFREQVRRNLVAIISLALAILSLSYNTWRNELTEHNRNVRQAGFEMLLTLGEVHQIVFFLHYDKDELAAQRVSDAVDDVREATIEALAVLR